MADVKADPKADKGVSPWLWWLLGGAAPGALAAIFGKDFDNFVLGKDASLEGFDLYDPEQKAYQEQFMSGASGVLPSAFGALGKLFGQDEASLKEFSAPYMRQFQTQVLPQIFERFGGGGQSGMGENAASSGLFNAATEAGAGLQAQIASDRQKQQMYGMSNLASLADIGMRPRRGYMNMPGQEGALHGLIKALPALAGLL